MYWRGSGLELLLNKSHRQDETRYLRAQQLYFGTKFVFMRIEVHVSRGHKLSTEAYIFILNKDSAFCSRRVCKLRITHFL